MDEKNKIRLCCLKETNIRYKETNTVKMKRMENTKVGVAILMLEKDFKAKKYITKDIDIISSDKGVR